LSTINKESPYTVKGAIVGDGPLRSQLENQAGQLGLLPDLIRFTGGVANMGELYEQADIFLLTSDWEGTPNVVLEAMSSGLPVVASRVGGVPDLIRHGETGYLADPELSDSYISPLMQMIKNPELRQTIAKNARQYVIDQHSLELLPTFLKNIYDQILS
jgi:glycosyltransferase involved in cell wall biosynthesis